MLALTMVSHNGRQAAGGLDRCGVVQLHGILRSRIVGRWGHYFATRLTRWGHDWSRTRCARQRALGRHRSCEGCKPRLRRAFGLAAGLSDAVWWCGDSKARIRGRQTYARELVRAAAGLRSLVPCFQQAIHRPNTSKQLSMPAVMRPSPCPRSKAWPARAPRSLREPPARCSRTTNMPSTAHRRPTCTAPAA
jgi:hypothetical protein